jgi:lysophospholipase
VSKELTLKTLDGIDLYGKADIPTNPKALVLLVHGLCEHQGRYDYVAARLNAQSVATFRFDHRGHGRSGGQRVFYSDFNEIVDDTMEAFKSAKQQVPDLPTFVLGHSMGGYAAALFATKYAGSADGIVLSGALTRYNLPLAGPLPIPGDPLTYLPNELGAGVCSDPAVGQAYVADPLVVKEMSIGLINSWKGGLDYLAAGPDKFTDPTLILHGANDGLVAEADSRQLFGEIASTDKALRIYPGMMHEILNEFRKDVVIADILDWIGQRL